MNVEQTENQLIIRETPGCLWLFGLFFAFVGGVFVYGALGGFTDYAQQSPLMLTFALVMGLIGVAGGIWIIYKAPITKIVADRIENTVMMTRYGLFGKREKFYDFDDIEYFCLLEEKDHEGDPIWSFAMKFKDEEIVKITSLASHSEEYERVYVFRVNEFMRKQLTSTQMIFEAEDEEDAEMR